MSGAVGQPLSRVDGRAKVTGAAIYAAEFDLPNLAYAVLVPSTVPSGRITAIDTEEAAHASGVCAVITHLNAPRLAYRPLKERPAVDPKSGEQLRVFQGPEVLFSGQPIGVVVADTLEQAQHAATLVRVKYETSPAQTEFDARKGRAPSGRTAKSGRPGESSRGDADRALAEAPVKVDAIYVHAREHHNAMETHATIAEWHGDRLTLYDKTQWVDNDRTEIAHVLGIPEKHIRVISPYVGGAFGSGLRTWPHVTVAALSARQVGRPVKLELSRRELYTSIGFRPHTEQRVALGAGGDGKLTALIQEATAQTSTYEEYAEETLFPARRIYSCPNVQTRYRLVEMNVNSPCPMRAPGISTGMLALETAMDELAVAFHMDPVELRLQNYAEQDEHENMPWSSKELRACYRLGADRFGWERRTAEPRSMHDGQLIGYGMATALFPSMRSAASASATLFADGTALVRTAASDMGPGTYTSMTQVAADTLGLSFDRVRFELGDTEMPKAPVHGGSTTMASVGNGVRAACEKVRSKALAFAREPFGPARLTEIPYGALLRQNGLDSIEATGHAKPGDEEDKFSSCAFGAVFVEVRVDPDFGTIRVPRIVGAYDAGRIVNPKTARSQCIGGLVGGLGMALLEQAEWDARFGRVMNSNFAEYLVPVNADIDELEVVFVPSDDRSFNPLGVKGLAELALCGVAPATANAVYHATGIRVRTLPITPEKLLVPPMP
jgi:xanthine dehydrogenase YagR molybdenum-binding subunit